MGPIEKKIELLLKNEELSEETIKVLTSLKLDIKHIEKDSLNNAYFQGYTDKERGQSPIWDYYGNRYRNYFSSFKVGELS